MRNRLAAALQSLELARPVYKTSDFERALAALAKPEPRRADYTSDRAFRRAIRKASR